MELKEIVMKKILSLFSILCLSMLIFVGCESGNNRDNLPTVDVPEANIPAVDPIDDDEDYEDYAYYKGDAYENYEDYGYYPYEGKEETYSAFLNFKQFLDVSIGESQDFVMELLGAPTSTMTMDIFGTESTTSTWMGNFLSLESTTVTFSNGYVSSIMQTFASTDVSADDFGGLGARVTEEEAYAKLGMPYSITVTEAIFGSGYTAFVMWINADFSSISIMFGQDGISTSISQMSLN